MFPVLRTLYDNIESNTRALKSVGIESEHFGPLLIPIVLEKIPNVIRLQISRKLGKDNWNIDEFLKCIREEISARESYEFLKRDEDVKDQESKKQFSSSLLYVGNNTKFCSFCKSKAL